MTAPPASPAAADATLPPHLRRVAIIAVTSLFFMWGFMTCLNDILVPHLKAIFSLNYLQASLIQFCFFGAYFIMSLPSGLVVARWGYQRGMVLGLVLTGLGAWLFYPAAALVWYPLFLGALFVLATGITLLQVSANPYISALGPSATASSRLNLAQAFNSLGTTVAPRIGGWLILSAVPAAAVADKLTVAASVKLPYPVLGLIAFLLAAVLASLRLPDLATVEEKSHTHSFFDALKIRHTALAVVAIFLYVGAEVSIGSYLINYLGLPRIAGLRPAAAALYVSFYWGGAMAGRFLGAAIMRKVAPQLVLGGNAIVAAVLSLAGAVLAGHAALWAVIGIGLFNSIMFPTIFTLGIARLGPRTSQGSSLLVMAIVGGALVPILMGQAADMFGLQLALVIPALCYLYIVFYAFAGSQPRPDEARL